MAGVGDVWGASSCPTWHGVVDLLLDLLHCKCSCLPCVCAGLAAQPWWLETGACILCSTSRAEARMWMAGQVAEPLWLQLPVAQSEVRL